MARARVGNRLTSPLAELSVVLPAYNEEKIIEQTLAQTQRFLGARGGRFEIIVVDDGSTDETGAIVARLAAVDSRIRLVPHRRNRGYGEALRSGFNAAEYEWVFLMDADGQFDITELDSFLPYAGSFDMIIGYRANRADPLPRAVFTWGYNAMMRVLFRLPVRDAGCAFKLFSRRSWRQVEPIIISHDHKVFSVEWLWRSQRAGVRLHELPVHHYPRQGGRATGMRPDVVWSMLRALVRLRFLA